MKGSCLCAGDLRHRITVQKATRTRDAVGGWTPETWGTLATVWAKVEPMSSGERYFRSKVDGNADWKVSIRYRADVTRGARIIYDGKTFEVRSVTDPDTRKRFLEIACEELHVTA